MSMHVSPSDLFIARLRDGSSDARAVVKALGLPSYTSAQALLQRVADAEAAVAATGAAAAAGGSSGKEAPTQPPEKEGGGETAEGEGDDENEDEDEDEDEDEEGARRAENVARAVRKFNEGAVEAEEKGRLAFLEKGVERVDEELSALREALDDWAARPAHKLAPWRTVNGRTFEETLALFRANRVAGGGGAGGGGGGGLALVGSC